jgi:hypothetical protein
MKNFVDYTCPHCENKFKIAVYPMINLQSESHLYEDLFSLDLFRVECSKCKKTSLVQYNTLIVDMYKKYIIYLLVDAGVNLDKLVENLRNNPEYAKVFDGLKYTRVVGSLNELLEKLLIFDYDLNDKVIEVLKLGLYSKDRLDKETYPNVCFNKIDRENLIFTCFNMADNKTQPIDISVNIKFYNLMIDKLGSLPPETTDFEFIDSVWAKMQVIDKNNE